jgi:uncharacterized protein
LFLLDVNLLIALLDEWHPHHSASLAFFPTAQAQGWATCPITENGFLRILGHPAYRDGPGTAEAARELLVELCASPGHQFWADDATLRDARLLAKLPASGQLTDAYLLALAADRGGQLATFDRRIDPRWVEGGKRALRVIAPG